MPTIATLRGAALLILAVCLAGCRTAVVQSSPTAEPAPIKAPLIQVDTQAFDATVTITGTLVSNARVDVKAETIGKIVRFDKEEGDPVAAGEPVVWVNDENFQLSLRQAETSVKVAEAGLERARLLESHSRSELQRADNLLKSGGITDKDLKASRMEAQDAAAQVAVAVAQLEQARAALELAQKRLRDATIQSPVSGVIQKKFVNMGAYVEAPTAVFAVVDNNRLELESPVAAADLAGIQPRQRVTFRVNSYPGVAFEGRVIEIGAAVEAETRSAKVRIQVINSAGKLKAGMFAEGEILTGSNAQAIVVPAAAVYRDDRSAKSAYAFVLHNGKAARRAIRLGRERDARVEVVEGLKRGDLLVAEQSLEIAEGVRVQAAR